CIIAHVNHGLRPEATEDENLVRNFAREIGAEFHCYRCDVASLAKERRQGIEETGREERYRFFRSLEADLILTAHHKDDHGETVLMHLIRGSGMRGLCGLSPLSDGIGRPLLCVTKEGIYRYCKEHRISYREDLSNEDTVYTRNKVRKELLPLMREINPDIIEALFRLSLSLEADEAYLERMALLSYEENLSRRGDELILNLPPDLYREPALARRWIRMAAKERGVELSFERTEAVRFLSVGKTLPLTAGLWVTRDYNHLVFGPKRQWIKENQEPVTITEGITESPDGAYRVTARRDRPGDKGSVSDHGFFPEELFQEEPPVLRRRLPGDYIVLSGGHRKKLSDYLIDGKVPLAERDCQLLLAVGSRVLWLVGTRFFALPGDRNLEIIIDKKN
ncbi:MAG: tRNA lysidine(34) synthetase TilS, partial [Clostridia bacterium]